MNKKTLNKVILRITYAWFLIGFILVGLLLAKVYSKDLFQTIFVVGFSIYALVVTLLSLLVSKAPDQE